MAKTNAEHCREYYRKNREKILAQARDKHAQNKEAMNARTRAQYAKHREKRVEWARKYRAENADAINARAMERYRERRDEINERRKGYRAKHYAKIYARIQKWREQNPERQFLYHAKRLLSEQTGIPFTDIPDDLAEAKMAQLEIHRALRLPTGDSE